MNKQLSTINWVVIHPKYRTIGLGARLIRETMPIVGTPYVEMIAIMAKYSPFAEKAGMQKTAEQQSVESASAVSSVLSDSGFDLHLLGSERYVEGKLKSKRYPILHFERGIHQKQASSLQKRICGLAGINLLEKHPII